jgi:hypothetical protein
VLGVIAPIAGESYAEKLIVHRQPLSAPAGAYRALRTKIHLYFFDQPMRTLLVTSSDPTEGKSVTLANLAIAMAEADLRVIRWTQTSVVRYSTRSSTSPIPGIESYPPDPRT